MLLKTITVGMLLVDFASGQVVEEAKVFHSGGLSDDRFGWSVAMDGSWAAITSRETTFTQYGSVYLYRSDPSGWTFVEEIQAFDKAPKDFFGFHVDLEGDRLIVGAHRDDNAMGVDAGAAYLFRWTGNDWSLEKKLVSPLGEANDVFGASVTISGDRIVVGAPNGGSFDGGAVHVWDLENGDWAETAYLEPTQMFGLLSNFGFRSAIHDDRVFVGSPMGSKVYVFEESADGGWTEIEVLLGVGRMGLEVAVSEDGKTLFAGANEDPDMGIQAGAVFVYGEQSPGSWSLVQKLYSSQPKADERFGHDLSLDGDRLLVGTQVNAIDKLAQPFVYLFEDQGGAWSEIERFTTNAPFASISGFGQAVAIRGQKILAGAPGDTGESFGTGSAYFFVLNTTPSPYCTGKTSSQGCTPTVDWGGSPTADGRRPRRLPRLDAQRGAREARALLLGPERSGRRSVPRRDAVRPAAARADPGPALERPAAVRGRLRPSLRPGHDGVGGPRPRRPGARPVLDARPGPSRRHRRRPDRRPGVYDWARAVARGRLSVRASARRCPRATSRPSSAGACRRAPSPRCGA